VSGDGLLIAPFNKGDIVITQKDHSRGGTGIKLATREFLEEPGGRGTPRLEERSFVGKKTLGKRFVEKKRGKQGHIWRKMRNQKD